MTHCRFPTHITVQSAFRIRASRSELTLVPPTGKSQLSHLYKFGLYMLAADCGFRTATIERNVDGSSTVTEPMVRGDLVQRMRSHKGGLVCSQNSCVARVGMHLQAFVFHEFLLSLPVQRSAAD